VIRDQQGGKSRQASHVLKRKTKSASGWWEEGAQKKRFIYADRAEQGKNNLKGRISRELCTPALPQRLPTGCDRWGGGDVKTLSVTVL